MEGGIGEARKKISDLEGAIEELGPAPGDIPEMLDSANLRRRADHLARSDKARSDLVSAYRQYCGALEDALRELVAVQRELASARKGLQGGAGGSKAPRKTAKKPKNRPAAARPRRPRPSGRTAKKPARRKPAAARKPAKKVPAGRATSRPRRPKSAGRTKAARRRPAKKARVRRAAPRRRR